jgi:O-antigen/teichoic acid export membrane protein
LAEDQGPRQRFPSHDRILARIAVLTPRIASFADQGLQGAANVLASALIARSLSHSDFAIIGLMIGAHYFAWGLHRSAVVLPYILDAVDGDIARKDAAWWWIGAVVSFALGAALLAGGAAWRAFGGGSAWIGEAMMWAALTSPALCLLEFVRRALYQRDRALLAASCSGIYAVGLVGGAGAVLLLQGDLRAAALCWPLSALTACAFGLAFTRPGAPRPRTISILWAPHRKFALEMGLTSVPYSIYTTTVVMLVGLFSGPLAAAGFTAGRTLTNPAMAVVSAIDTLDKPRAVRALAADGLDGLAGSIGRTRRTVVLLTGPYLLILAVGAPWILDKAFGSGYGEFALGVQLLAVSFFMTGLNQPSETALIVLKASRTMLVIRSVVASLTVAGLWAFGATWGFVGCAAAILAVNTLNVGALRAAEYRAGVKRA